MTSIAILDDYLDCALALADWSSLDCKVTVFSEPLPAETLATALAPFEGLVLMRDRTTITRELLAQLPRLRFITYSGPSNLALDGAAAIEAGIVLSNTASPNGLVEHFEFIWALLMATMRNIPAHDAEVRAGGWQSGFGLALHGRTIGVLGMGNFGRMVAEMARRFGMNVLAWSHNLTESAASAVGAELVSLDELLARSDVLTIHLRLSERTAGLIGAREFALMKTGSVLINTSRGPIVDEGALLDALVKGPLHRAGLDVFAKEPLPVGHALRSLPNVVLSPHMGFSTEELLRSYYTQMRDNVAAWLAGAPARVVNAATIAGH